MDETCVLLLTWKLEKYEHPKRTKRTNLAPCFRLWQRVLDGENSLRTIRVFVKIFSPMGDSTEAAMIVVFWVICIHVWRTISASYIQVHIDFIRNQYFVLVKKYITESSDRKSSWKQAVMAAKSPGYSFILFAVLSRRSKLQVFGSRALCDLFYSQDRLMWNTNIISGETFSSLKSDELMTYWQILHNVKHL